MKIKLKLIFIVILLSNSLFISLLSNVICIEGVTVISKQNPIQLKSIDTFPPSFSRNFNEFELYLDNSNQIVIGGHFSHDQYDSLLLMTDMQGNLLWENLSSIGNIYDFAIDSLGNIYCTGVKYDATHEILFLKYSKTGEFLWDKTLNANGNEWGRCISIDSKDNIYIAGYNSSIDTYEEEMICAKYNASGEQEWLRAWGKDKDAKCLDCTTDISNNFYLAGYLETPLHYDMCIVKYDSLGNEMWNKTFPYKDSIITNERLWTITSDKNGNIYVAGDLENKGIYLASFDSTGINLWNTTRAIYTDKVLGVDDLAIDFEGNVFIIGNYRPYDSGDWRYNDHLYNYIIKYKDGIEQWHYYWKFSDFNLVGGIVLNQEDIYLCGSTEGTLYLAKFSETLPIVPLYILFSWVGTALVIFVGTSLLKKKQL
jgi:hypothetical protein